MILEQGVAERLGRGSREEERLRLQQQVSETEGRQGSEAKGREKIKGSEAKGREKNETKRR